MPYAFCLCLVMPYVLGEEAYKIVLNCTDWLLTPNPLLTYMDISMQQCLPYGLCFVSLCWVFWSIA